MLKFVWLLKVCQISMEKLDLQSQIYQAFRYSSWLTIASSDLIFLSGAYFKILKTLITLFDESFTRMVAMVRSNVRLGKFRGISNITW